MNRKVLETIASAKEGAGTRKILPQQTIRPMGIKDLASTARRYLRWLQSSGSTQKSVNKLSAASPSEELPVLRRDDERTSEELPNLGPWRPLLGTEYGQYVCLNRAIWFEQASGLKVYLEEGCYIYRHPDSIYVWYTKRQFSLALRLSDQFRGRDAFAPGANGGDNTYRKKPVQVEALRWREHGDDPDVMPLSRVRFENATDEAWQTVREGCDQCDAPFERHGWIGTLEGGHRVCPGDWIITGVEGERYPCKPSVFEKTYEPV